MCRFAQGNQRDLPVYLRGIMSTKGVHGRVSVDTLDRPLTDTSSDTDRHLHGYLANIRLTLNKQLDQRSINSQSIVGQVSIDSMY